MSLSIYNTLPENNYAMQLVQNIARTGSEISAADHPGYLQLVEAGIPHATPDNPLSWKMSAETNVGSGINRLVTVEYLTPAGAELFGSCGANYYIANVEAKLTSEKIVQHEDGPNKDQQSTLIMGFTPESLLSALSFVIKFPLDAEMIAQTYAEWRKWGVGVVFHLKDQENQVGVELTPDRVRLALHQLQVLRGTANT